MKKNSNLLKLLDQVDASNDKDFSEVLSKAQVSLGLSDGDLADQVGASISTIQRWKEGVSQPYVKIRLGVIKLLRVKAESV